MSSGAFSWSNKITSSSTVSVGTVSGTFSTLAIDSGYPAANSLNDDPSSVTRVNFTASSGTNPEFYIEWNWSSNDTARVLGAFNVRLPTNVIGLRFRGINAAGTTQFTTTQVLRSLGQLVLLAGHTDRYQLPSILSADYLINRIRLLVQVNTSASGYVEIGKPWAGLGCVWENGFGADFRMGYVDQSKVSRRPGGGFSAYRYPRRRVLSLTKRGLAYADAMGADGLANSLRDAIADVGVSSPCVAITTDKTNHKLGALSVYGLLAEMPDLEHLGADLYGTAMRVEEVR